MLESNYFIIWVQKYPAHLCNTTMHVTYVYEPVSVVFTKYLSYKFIKAKISAILW